jgi:hypothetical protein
MAPMALCAAPQNISLILSRIVVDPRKNKKIKKNHSRHATFWLLARF